jgi:hypothetical protein
MKSVARESAIHYRAQVELTEPKFRNLPSDFALKPGMRLVADIKIGRRSVLEYLLNRSPASSPIASENRNRPRSSGLTSGAGPNSGIACPGAGGATDFLGGGAFW